MKKDFHKLIDYMRNKLPKWMNSQNLIFLIVILAFIIILWSEPLSHFFKGKQSLDTASTAVPTILPDILTSLPEEWIRSAEQTNGVILGAIIIIFAVVAGTAVIMIRDRE